MVTAWRYTKQGYSSTPNKLPLAKPDQGKRGDYLNFKVSLHKNISREAVSDFPISVQQFSINTTCIKSWKQRALYRKWPKHFSKDSLTKVLLYRRIRELPQGCCHRSSTKFCDVKRMLKYFTAIYFRQNQSSRAVPSPRFPQWISAVAEAGGKGAHPAWGRYQ